VTTRGSFGMLLPSEIRMARLPVSTPEGLAGSSSLSPATGGVGAGNIPRT
jgi:hypothetical protein